MTTLLTVMTLGALLFAAAVAFCLRLAALDWAGKPPRFRRLWFAFGFVTAGVTGGVAATVLFILLLFGLSVLRLR